MVSPTSNIDTQIKQILTDYKLGSGNSQLVPSPHPLLDYNTVFSDHNLKGYRLRHGDNYYEISFNKIVISKNIIEVHRYEKPVFLNQPRYRKKLKIPDDNYIKQNIEQTNNDRKQEYKKRSSIRSINNIRRLVNCNFTDKDKFMTLTFNDENDFNIKEIKETHRVFKTFIQRLKRKYPKLELKYIAIPEYQDKNGRGAVHYHMIVNIPYTKKGILADIWGYGFIKINKIKTLNVGNYISKYMSKNSFDERYGKSKRILRSRNLETSEILYGKKANDFITKYKLNEIQPYYISRYSGMLNGKIIIGYFNLDNLSPAQNNNKYV